MKTVTNGYVQHKSEWRDREDRFLKIVSTTVDGGVDVVVKNGRLSQSIGMSRSEMREFCNVTLSMLDELATERKCLLCNLYVEEEKHICKFCNESIEEYGAAILFWEQYGSDVGKWAEGCFQVIGDMTKDEIQKIVSNFRRIE